jgi:hypothetical protein
MSILASDPLTQIAFSVYENKGVYALLVGSGLSRSAGIPTGWEITLDLVRRVAAAQDVEDQPDWAAWYRTKTGKEPNYSELVDELGASPEERRSILHSYIEPDVSNPEEGGKRPTKAHHAIARLVRDGFIRVIVTTNFDRLIENALREQGVEPTVIASVDALKGAEPIIHSSCYLVKLHGDYKDARILNTEKELERYDPEYDRLLDQIIDQHGLIICGWSGEWDHALRSALLRAPARRYSLYWATRGNLADGAKEISRQRAAREVKIEDADAFFEGIETRVQTLARTHRRNPLSIDLLIGTAKRYLAKREHHIQLHDLVSDEVKLLIEKLDSADLSPGGHLYDAELKNEIRRRAGLYESLTEPLARVAGLMGVWGDGSERSWMHGAIAKLCAHADRVLAGNTTWRSMRDYPAFLVMTAYGVGLVRSERWADLHRLYSAQLPDEETGGMQRAVDRLFLLRGAMSNNISWKNPGGVWENTITPFSDHLYAIYLYWGGSFLGALSDFEIVYQRWEILEALTYLERYDLAIVKFELDRVDRKMDVQLPIGRSAWRKSVRDRILEEIRSNEKKPALIDAGFGGGDAAFLDTSLGLYNRRAEDLRVAR